jgi:hypothetical protein
LVPCIVDIDRLVHLFLSCILFSCSDMPIGLPRPLGPRVSSSGSPLYVKIDKLQAQALEGWGLPSPSPLVRGACAALCAPALVRARAVPRSRLCQSAVPRSRLRSSVSTLLHCAINVLSRQMPRVEAWPHGAQVDITEKDAQTAYYDTADPDLGADGSDDDACHGCEHGENGGRCHNAVHRQSCSGREDCGQVPAASRGRSRFCARRHADIARRVGFHQGFLLTVFGIYWLLCPCVFSVIRGHHGTGCMERVDTAFQAIHHHSTTPRGATRQSWK